MATFSNWTVVFEDKIIINQNMKSTDGVTSVAYKIENDNLDYNDTVEYRDETPHATWNNANLGNFRSEFVDKWDAALLTKLQADWDNNNGDTFDAEGNLVATESESQKIERLGPRPTSYSSY